MALDKAQISWTGREGEGAREHIQGSCVGCYSAAKVPSQK